MILFFAFRGYLRNVRVLVFFPLIPFATRALSGEFPYPVLKLRPVICVPLRNPRLKSVPPPW